MSTVLSKKQMTEEDISVDYIYRLMYS